MKSSELFVTALCPTYRHPQLLANSVRLWEAQDYPAHLRRLIIYDDGGTFADQQSPARSSPLPDGMTSTTTDGIGWELRSWLVRFPSLPAKYNAMLAAIPPETDVVLVWEDDDIYLPGYVSAYVRALQKAELCKPTVVLSDYPRHIVAENGAGRFHSSLGFRRELIERVGGWPNTKRADFDQQLIGTLQREANSIGDPWSSARACQYVMGWHTGAAHGQNTMRGPDDETWYDRNEQSYVPVPYVGQLVPRLDDRTRRIMEAVKQL